MSEVFCCTCGEVMLFDEEQQVAFVCMACGQRCEVEPELHPAVLALKELAGHNRPDWEKHFARKTPFVAGYVETFCEHVLAGLTIDEAKERALTDI